MPTLTVIAAPNGSGKSTFAQAMKLGTIDSDRLAAGYGQGFTPEANLRASREALQIMQDRLQERQSFAIETTLAGCQPLRLMDQAVEAGYRVHLAFIVPNDQEDTQLRIENRVMRGGHNISDDAGKWYPSADPNAWDVLGGQTTGSPAMVSWGEQRLDVFACGSDGQMLQKYWNSQYWVPWP